MTAPALAIHPDFLKRYIKTIFDNLQQGSHHSMTTPRFAIWFKISQHRKRLHRENPHITNIEIHPVKNHERYVYQATVTVLYKVDIGSEILPFPHKELWSFTYESEKLRLDDIEIS